MLNLPVVAEHELIPLDLAEEIDALCAAVESVIVSDIPSYEQAAAARKGCKAMVKRLDEQRKEWTQPLDEQKADIMAAFRRPQERLAATEKELGKRLQAWDAEQQRIKDEEARRVNEALKAKAEEERRQAEAAALKALQQGKDHIAERMLAKAEAVKPVEVVAAPVKAAGKGAHYRETWKHEVTDFAALPDAYKVANDVLLGTIARGQHDAMQIPGVRFYAERTLI